MCKFSTGKGAFMKRLIMLVCLLGSFCFTRHTAQLNDVTTENGVERSVINYAGSVSYEMLPPDCLLVLNDEYCISKNVEDSTGDVTAQFPRMRETVYLHNTLTGERKSIYAPPEGHSTFGYIINDNHVLWIEHGVNRGKIVSGEWKIMLFDLNTETVKEVDSGKFNDFSKYSYDEVNFGDAGALFPAQLDISRGNVIAYNRMIEKSDGLYSQIVTRDLLTDSHAVIAEGNSVIDCYVYGVSIDGNRVAYTKYHELNNTYQFRPTTYKYCDIFLYDTATKETTQITSNDFYTGICVNDNYIAAARIPEREAGQDVFARMQIVLYDMESEKFHTAVTYQSPIYSGLSDLTVESPKFLGDYLVWSEGVPKKGLYVYDYKKEEFVRLPAYGDALQSKITNVTDCAVIVFDFADYEPGNTYKIILR
jgi:hypothetical protein